MSTTQHDRAERTFLGQPRPLAHLFGVEMWERFSFYGMQAILVLYLSYETSQGGLGLPDSSATSVVGAYGGLVYLSTIVGAWLADRLLGSERVLFFSAVAIMLGHVALAVLPGLAGVGVGLVLVGFGSGGLKANATALVGDLYDDSDPRRDAGFSLFYMGINLGALVGPLLTGLAQQEIGFHVGFGIAAVGMALGLAQYAWGRRGMPASSHDVPDPLPRSAYGRWTFVAMAAVVVVVVAAATGLLTAGNLSDVVVALSVIAAVGYFVFLLTSPLVTAVERSRVWAMVPMFVASAAFWSLYQQQFTVVPLYAKSRLDRGILGWEMPVAWVNSINPVFIIVLAGAFAALWTRLGTRQPSTPVKFGLGTAGMGVAFLLFLPMAGGGPSSAPLLGLVGIIFVFTVAELLLSPVGLSLSTKLAPEHFKSQMVALFFLSVALGTAMSGTLAGFYSADRESAYFGVLGAAAIVIGAALLLARRPVLRLMRGVS